MKMEALNVFIGGKIQEIRSGKNISQEALAKSIGMSRVSICNIEAGNGIKLSRVFDICFALGVEICDIIPDINWYINNKGKKVKKVITYEIQE